MTQTWKCGHPRTPENTCGVSEKRPRGQCRECLKACQWRYRMTAKGLEANRRSHAEERDNGKQRARKQRHIALGWNAKWKREQYARIKAYEAEVWADTPEKRHSV